MRIDPRDPNKKSFELDARTMCAKKREELLEELDKCDLLCMNCHQELHHPNASNW
jgi:hypothetical protein